MYSSFMRGNLFWILPFLLLEMILKSYALWRAGRNNQPYWFIALAVVNSLGILPIIYLVFFQVKEKTPKRKNSR